MPRDLGSLALARSEWRALARAAIHEAGHVCLAVHLGWGHLLRSMAITSEGSWTELEGEEDLENQSVDLLFDRIAIDLGGVAAERSLIGSAAAKAGSDVAAATRLAVFLAQRGLLPTVPMVDLKALETGLGTAPLDHVLTRVLACLDAAADAAAQAVLANVTKVRGLALLLLIAPGQKLEGEPLEKAIDACAFAPGDTHPTGDDPLDVLRSVGSDFQPAWDELEALMVAGPPAPRS